MIILIYHVFKWIYSSSPFIHFGLFLKSLCTFLFVNIIVTTRDFIAFNDYNFISVYVIDLFSVMVIIWHSFIYF
jgi:hypothetical protein